MFAVFGLSPLSLLFFSKKYSPFPMIGTDSVFTVELNGNGRAKRGIVLPDFLVEELDIEVTED